jgi:predicted RNase H-like HicB family nuclease
VKRTFTASVSKEGHWFVAQCLEVDIASQAETEAEALANLREALELHYEDPQATVQPKMHRVKIDVRAA